VVTALTFERDRVERQSPGGVPLAVRRFLARHPQHSTRIQITRMNTGKSYDDLAGLYHLIFQDWDASIERQAVSVSRILQKFGVEATRQCILDCACGIGTQSLGLAKLGFEITGCDISSAAIERARREASQRGLDIRFLVADMRDLTALGGALFDAVICMDNSLPHLTTEEELLQAARQIRSTLRPGGVFIASLRDYDLLLGQRPTVQGPFFYGNEQSRRIVFQVWDWIDELLYRFHLYITRRIAGEWETFHTTALYRGFRRNELEAVFKQAGFVNTAWIFPAESGFYQPIFTAQVGVTGSR